MKKTNRIICLAILMVLLLTSVIALAACGKSKTALESYMPSFANSSVKDDFELPRTIGDGVKVKWKSNNEDAIEIEKRGSKESYIAHVHLGDQVQAVTLTVSATGAGKKDFIVNVQALNAMLIAQEYEFKQKGAEVSADFELPTEVTVRGVTATVTWSVDAQYSEWLSVSGTTCHVTVPAETTRVEIKATFSYKGNTATMPYTFYVAQPKTQREIINNWYNNTDVSMPEFDGYIVGIAGAYDESYGNGSYYVVSENLEFGMYLYQATPSGNLDKAVPGTHITVTKAISTSYSGLWETTGKGAATFTINEDKPAKDVSELVYALDGDAISGSPALKWHTSALVSLTNWTVDSVAKDSTDATATTLTISKDGAKLTVAYSKYMAGFYDSTNANDATFVAIKDKCKTFKAGDGISVTGILTYYGDGKTFQVLPRSADDIKTGTAESGSDGSKVKAAMNAVDTALKTGGYTAGALITAAKEFNLPTSEQGVAIKYTPCFAGDSVAIDGGKINVTPKDKLQNVNIEVEYSIGNYKTWTYFNLRSQDLDDQGKVDYVASLINAFDAIEVKKDGEVELPAFETLGTTVTWSMKEGTQPDWLTLGTTISVVLPDEATSLMLRATVKLNDKTATADVVFNFRASSGGLAFVAFDEPAEGDFIFSAIKGETRLYASSLTLDSGNEGYIVTSDDPSEAVEFTLVKHGDTGWYIKMGDKYLEINPYVNKEKTSYKLKLVDEATAEWKWHAETKVFYQAATELTGDSPATNDFYIGTYNTSSYTTLSPSNMTYIWENNEAKEALDTTQHPGRFGTMEKVALAFKAIDEPAEGDFIFSAIKGETRLYASSLTLDSGNEGYIVTSDDPSEAVEFTLVKHGDTGWYIKMGDKYLEINPYVNKEKTSYKLKLVDEATAEWKWHAETKVFYQAATELTGDSPATNDFYIGTYNTSSYTTLSPSNMTYIWENNEAKEALDTTQHPGRFGTMVPETEIEQPEPEPEPELPEFEFTKWTEGKAGEAYIKVTVQDKTYFLTGQISGYYYATSQDASKAGVFTIEQVEDGYTIKNAEGKYLEILFAPNSDNPSNPYSNVKLNATQTEGCIWKFDTDINTFTMQGIGEYSGLTAYLGMYIKSDGNLARETVGASNVSYVKGDNPSSTNFIAEFGDLTVTGEGGGDVGGGDEPSEKAPLDTDFNTTNFDELNEKGLAGADGKFYAIGYVKTITDAYNSTIVLEDAEGKTFQIYGVFNEDGTSRNQTPSSTLKEGDVVVFYGSVTSYAGTAQMANGWLVQVGTEAKTNAAEIYLAELIVPQEVRADFTLPEGVTWTVKSGEGIEISGTNATVKRTAEAQTVVITGTYSIGDKEGTKDYTVVVRAKPEGGDTIIINFKELGRGLHEIIGFQTDTTATTFTVDTLALQCYNCKKGTETTENPYLMLNKKSPANAYLANTVAVPGAITKIEVEIPSGASGKTTYYIALSKTAQLANQSTGTSYTGNGQTFTVNATAEDDFRFFNISLGNNNNGQIAKITITYADAAE